VAIFLKLAILTHPEMVLATNQSQIIWLKLSGVLETVLGRSPFLITFFAVVNLFGQAIFVNRIANRHHLYPKATYLPALTYILVTSLFEDWNYLSAALISNWLLLAMLSAMLQLYSAGDVRKQIFNIGCFISITAMLVFPNIIFIALLLLSLAILRPFKVAEWLVGLLGLLTPFYFLAGILYLTNDLVLLKRMVSIGFSIPKHIEQPELMTICFSMIGLMLIVGIFYLNNFMGRMLFQNKKWWWVVIASFVISIVAGIFTVSKGYNQWMAVLIPTSFLIANAWFEERRKWITTIFFYLFVAVIIFAQWAPEGMLAQKAPAPKNKKTAVLHKEHLIFKIVNTPL
jgi:hypothetical protein